MGLAIGFILGGSAQAVVSSLVDDIVDPVIGLIFGTREGLGILEYKGIMFGSFLNVLIDFFIIAFLVYFLFKVFSLEKLDKKD